MNSRVYVYFIKYGKYQQHKEGNEKHPHPSLALQSIFGITFLSRSFRDDGFSQSVI